MSMDRRRFLTGSLAGAAGLSAAGADPGGAAQPQAESGARRGNPIAVSTYSFWQFRDEAKVPIERCIDLAAEMGFDAV